VCMCVDVCHPNESVTCGVYGQNVSVYFVITPALQMNLSDTHWVDIRGNNGINFSFYFGNPVTQVQLGNVMPIHPECTCGIVVNNASGHDSGQYVCTVTLLSPVVTIVVTSKQTLQLCGR
jgi:hypothetical protein